MPPKAYGSCNAIDLALQQAALANTSKIYKSHARQRKIDNLKNKMQGLNQKVTSAEEGLNALWQANETVIQNQYKFYILLTFILPGAASLTGPVSSAASLISLVVKDIITLLHLSVYLFVISIALLSIVALVTSYFYRKYITQEMNDLQNKIININSKYKEQQKKISLNLANLKSKLEKFTAMLTDEVDPAALTLLTHFQLTVEEIILNFSPMLSPQSPLSNDKTLIKRRLHHGLISGISFIGVASALLGTVTLISIGVMSGPIGWGILALAIVFAASVAIAHYYYLSRTTQLENRLREKEEKLAIVRKQAEKLQLLCDLAETIDHLMMKDCLNAISELEQIVLLDYQNNQHFSAIPEIFSDTDNTQYSKLSLGLIVFGTSINNITSSFCTFIVSARIMVHVTGLSVGFIAGISSGVGIITILTTILYYYHADQELKKVNHVIKKYQNEIASLKKEQEKIDNEIINLLSVMYNIQAKENIIRLMLNDKNSELNKYLGSLSSIKQTAKNRQETSQESNTSYDRGLFKIIAIFSGITFTTAVIGTVALFAVGILATPVGWALLALSVIAAAIFLYQHYQYLKHFKVKDAYVDKLKYHAEEMAEDYEKRLIQKTILNSLHSIKELPSTSQATQSPADSADGISQQIVAARKQSYNLKKLAYLDLAVSANSHHQDNESVDNEIINDNQSCFSI